MFSVNTNEDQTGRFGSSCMARHLDKTHTSETDVPLSHKTFLSLQLDKLQALCCAMCCTWAP